MDHKIISTTEYGNATVSYSVNLIPHNSDEEKAIEAVQLEINKGRVIATHDQQDMINNYVYSNFNNKKQTVVAIVPTGSGTTIIIINVLLING